MDANSGWMASWECGQAKGRCRFHEDLERKGGPFESVMVCVMPRTAKPKQRTPHEFVLEALTPLKPEVRRMFSGFGVYVASASCLCCAITRNLRGTMESGSFFQTAPIPQIRSFGASSLLSVRLSCCATRSDTGFSFRVTARASRLRRFMRAICCCGGTLA